MLVPEVVFETGPDNFRNAGLLSKDEAVAVMGGFEGSKAKGLGNRAHHKNVRDGVDVAELTTADEASKDDVFGNA